MIFYGLSLGGGTSGGAADVPSGGTGVTSLTAYAPIFGGTTSTGPVQSGAVGTAGHVLTSNGAGAIATFQALPGGSSGANPSASVGLTAVNGVATTFLRSDGAPALDQGINPTMTGNWIFSKNAAASTPTIRLNGTVFAGTGTTSFGLVHFETTGATPATSWSTSGTYIAINTPTGYGGDFLNFKVNGGATSRYMVQGTGAVVSASTMTATGFVFVGATTTGISNSGTVLFLRSNNATVVNIDSGVGVYPEGNLTYPLGTNSFRWSRLQCGGLLPATAVKTGDYTATTNDHTIRCDATAGAITITLPAASNLTLILVIKKTDASVNNVVIDANASETIDGATTQTLTIQYSSLMIQANGSGWDILASHL